MEAERDLMARVTGSLYACGAVLVLVSLLLPHPAAANEGVLLVVAGGATAVAAVTLGAGRRFPLAVHHALPALGSVLICACVYASGVAVGVYSSMFVWVVLMTAFFFPGVGAAAHLSWLLACYAVTIAALDKSPYYSGLTRWILTAFALAITATAVSWLSLRRRETDARLRAEIAERKRLEVALRHDADHDSLTGLPNRRHFQAELERELARAQRSGLGPCVAIVDVDGLKATNDRHGHAAGDALLQGAADAWRRAVRRSDLLARYGGDEFAVMLPECSAGAAAEVILRLQGAGEFPCSAGLVAWDGVETATALINRADAELYDAKRAGGGRLQVASG